MRLIGAVAPNEIVGRDALPGRSNYLIGRDPSNWHTGVPTFRKVIEREVYPGIDLIFHGEQRHLEYDFVVSPGADPKSICFSFDGVIDQEINRNGDLVLRFIDGKELRFLKPVVYEQAGSRRHSVSGDFLKIRDSQFSFAVGPYDRSHTLVIDPVLSYSTYLGGTDTDFAVRNTVDSSGHAYVVGYTASSDFPTKNAFQSLDKSPSNCQFQLECLNGTTAFVSKLNATGTGLVYSTFLGGKLGVNGRPVTDVGVGIALDSVGNAYVTGSASSTDFPTTSGAFQRTYPGGSGVASPFITKLNPSGSGLVYSTYLGGPTGPPDSGIGITLDTTGDAYVTGYTYSGKFPTTSGAFSRVCKVDSANNCSGDVFVSKLNSTGSALVYSTYVGGSGVDVPTAIAIDVARNAYIAGGTFSANYPTTTGAPQRTFAGPRSGFGFCGNLSALIPCGDAFVTKMNATGSKLLYSTYLGGDNEELGMDLKVDSSGSAYVTGFTHSTNFPVTPGAFQTQPQGDATFELGDAFVTKINPAGTALAYSTYLGGDGYEMGSALALDKNNDAYISGITESANFPLKAPLQVINDPSNWLNLPASHNAATTLFVTELNGAGTGLKFSTVLGGGTNRTNIASGIALDSKGAIYITGVDGGDLPISSGAFQQKCHMTSGICDYDAFVAKISFPASPAVLFTPRTIDFGTVIVGTTSPTMPFTITNQGNAALKISSITLNGPANFIESDNTCGATLAAGASCGIKFAAKPTGTIPSCCFSAIFVTDNASISPQISSMSATAVAATVSPTALRFPAQKVGTTSPPQKLTLTNHASTSLTFTFSVGNTKDFGISSNPCGTIAAGKSCALSVVFHPQSTGSRFGQITIDDSANDRMNVSLTGTGQ